MCRDDNLNSLLAKLGVLVLLVAAYRKFDELELRQQVLWAFNEIVRLPNNVKRMDRDGGKLVIKELLKVLVVRVPPLRCRRVTPLDAATAPHSRRLGH
jgi:hypothetical protein